MIRLRPNGYPYLLPSCKQLPTRSGHHGNVPTLQDRLVVGAELLQLQHEHPVQIIAKLQVRSQVLARQSSGDFPRIRANNRALSHPEIRLRTLQLSYRIYRLLPNFLRRHSHHNLRRSLYHLSLLMLVLLRHSIVPVPIITTDLRIRFQHHFRIHIRYHLVPLTTHPALRTIQAPHHPKAHTQGCRRQSRLPFQHTNSTSHSCTGMVLVPMGLLKCHLPSHLSRFLFRRHQHHLNNSPHHLLTSNKYPYHMLCHLPCLIPVRPLQISRRPFLATVQGAHAECQLQTLCSGQWVRLTACEVRALEVSDPRRLNAELECSRHIRSACRRTSERASRVSSPSRNRAREPHRIPGRSLKMEERRSARMSKLSILRIG